MHELTRDRLLMAVISGRGPAYLRGVDLSSLDLSNAGWLVKADLRQANLSNANLSRANLKDSNLSNADLHAANLTGANCEGADFTEAKLTVANLRMTVLRQANLQSAGMVGARLIHARLTGANLEGADLEGANLEGADLSGAKLNLANLSMANLRGANLEGASLVGTILDDDATILRMKVPPSGFAGMVNHVHLTDLIQMVCLSHSSALIQIMSGETEGKIYVREGRIFHAETGVIEGEEAISEMLKWSNGRFETLSLSDEPETSITKPFEQLLYESVRQFDESTYNGRLQTGFIEEIKNSLPIPAFASEELVRLMGQEGKDVDVREELSIDDVFYSEATGSILCSLVSGQGTFIAPLAYVQPKVDHPLAEQILSYRSDNKDEKFAT